MPIPPGAAHAVRNHGKPQSGRGAGEMTQVENDDALRLSAARFREVVDRAPDGIFISDSSRRYIDVNAAGCSLLGFAKEEIVGTMVADRLLPEDLVRLDETVRNLTDVGQRPHRRMVAEAQRRRFLARRAQLHHLAGWEGAGFRTRRLGVEGPQASIRSSRTCRR